MTTQKTAYQGKHVKGTTAIALFYNGKDCGKVVANWSDNPAGTVCTATVFLWGKDNPMLTAEKFAENKYTDGTGRAGGYGYDKLSQAVYFALKNAGIEPKVVKPANGLTQKEFEHYGITAFQVI